jgi:hypothetical protein
MINKEIEFESTLPLYKVEELTMLQAMIMLKSERGVVGEPFVEKALSCYSTGEGQVEARDAAA